MLLVDKYCKEINNINCHEEIIKTLLNIFNSYSTINICDLKKNINKLDNRKFKYANFQHIIIYGKEGCGKNFIINKLLENIYGKPNIKLNNVEYEISGYSNSKIKINIKQSNYHIIIEPNSNGFDKYLLQDVLQKYINTKILNIIKYEKLFKIVIIDKIDDLSYYAQAALRRTMEKHSTSCKFIFISNQLSKIIEPLKSRCLQVRIPLPTNIELSNIILSVSHKENINLTLINIKKILKRSKNNLYIIFWLLEMKKYNIPYKKNWRHIIKKIVKLVLTNNHSSNSLNNVLIKFREYFYILYITNIKFNDLIFELMNNILKKLSNLDLKFNIIDLTSEVETRVNNGTRYLIHLEYYILKIIDLLKNNNNKNLKIHI